METAIAQKYARRAVRRPLGRAWTDSIVSLAVIVEYAEGTSHYYIYHFDCANSIELDSAHMLRRLGISMDDYTQPSAARPRRHSTASMPGSILRSAAGQPICCSCAP